MIALAPINIMVVTRKKVTMFMEKEIDSLYKARNSLSPHLPNHLHQARTRDSPSFFWTESSHTFAAALMSRNSPYCSHIGINSPNSRLPAVWRLGVIRCLNRNRKGVVSRSTFRLLPPLSGRH